MLRLNTNRAENRARRGGRNMVALGVSLGYVVLQIHSPRRGRKNGCHRTRMDSQISQALSGSDSYARYAGFGIILPNIPRLTPGATISRPLRGLVLPLNVKRETKNVNRGFAL